MRWSIIARAGWAEQRGHRWYRGGVLNLRLTIDDSSKLSVSTAYPTPSEPDADRL